MAEKPKKEEAPPAAAGGHEKKDAAKSGGGLMTKTPVLLGGVMIIEAAVLFGGFKFLGSGPQASAGAPLSDETHASEEGGHGESSDGHGGGGGGAKPPADGKKPIEIPVLDFKAPNKITGRTFLYDVSIFVVTRGEHAEKVKAVFNDRGALIKDRIRTIIAQMDPEKLGGGSEPGLETLRRQVKYQLDEIVGEGIIEEVLVPRCIGVRADY